MATNRHSQARPRPFCAVCGSICQLSQSEHGWVCESCTTRLRQGKDATTASVRELQRSMRQRSRMIKSNAQGVGVSEQQLYEVEAMETLALDSLQSPMHSTLSTGGEAVPPVTHDLYNTLATPTTTALDASAERLDLVSAFGTDVAALALDAAESIRADNSLEKMLAHQLAVAHSSYMQMMCKAALQSDPLLAIKLYKLASRLMEVYQRGLVTLKRLRSAGEQQITVQHVHVASGAQAVVGNVKTGGQV